MIHTRTSGKTSPALHPIGRRSLPPADCLRACYLINLVCRPLPYAAPTIVHRYGQLIARAACRTAIRSVPPLLASGALFSRSASTSKPSAGWSRSFGQPCSPRKRRVTSARLRRTPLRLRPPCSSAPKRASISANTRSRGMGGLSGRRDHTHRPARIGHRPNPRRGPSLACGTDSYSENQRVTRGNGDVVARLRPAPASEQAVLTPLRHF